MCYDRPVRGVHGLCLLFTACVGTEPGTASDGAVTTWDATGHGGGVPSVELATGGRTWQDLPRDGSGRAEVVFGPQGGYHIFGRVRFQGIEPNVTLRFRVTSLDGTRVLTDDRDVIRRTLNRGLLALGGGVYESTSGELVILQIRGPMDVVGQRWRMEVQVTPADQSPPLTTECSFTIVDDEP